MGRSRTSRAWRRRPSVPYVPLGGTRRSVGKVKRVGVRVDGGIYCRGVCTLLLRLALMMLLLSFPVACAIDLVANAS